MLRGGVGPEAEGKNLLPKYDILSSSLILSALLFALRL